ncbi:MAG: hypothetical protein HKO82_14815 [Acidimicrobiia bacterium]|nr:hypothetical protein [Acidimicrobiia bacterium]NNL14951.1 hypothetical protein [Acidimicrobiia bacterium]
MPDDDLPVDEEHFDSIPWSSLMPQTQNRPWLVYVAAGAIVAVVIGMLAARSLPGRAPVAEPVPVATTLPPQPTAPASSSPPTSLLLSEADLRADLPAADGGADTAAMRAEWFVTDYFTRDAAGGRETELAGALGRPFYTVSSDVTTYVEWARAWGTIPEGDGRYRVSVAYRSITATERGFQRGLVHAVEVLVQVGAEGGTRVVDLPEPTALPPAPAPANPPAPELVSEEIAAAALEAAAGWGDPISVVEGTQYADSWDVLVEIADDHGTIWPMMVWVEPDQ